MAKAWWRKSANLSYGSRRRHLNASQATLVRTSRQRRDHTLDLVFRDRRCRRAVGRRQKRVAGDPWPRLHRRWTGWMPGTLTTWYVAPSWRARSSSAPRCRPIWWPKSPRRMRGCRPSTASTPRSRFSARHAPRVSTSACSLSAAALAQAAPCSSWSGLSRRVASPRCEAEPTCAHPHLDAIADRRAVLAPDRDAPGGADRALALASSRVTAAKAKVAEATVMADDSVGPERCLHGDPGGHRVTIILGRHFAISATGSSALRTPVKAVAPRRQACRRAEPRALSRCAADCRRQIRRLQSPRPTDAGRWAA